MDDDKEEVCYIGLMKSLKMVMLLLMALLLSLVPVDGATIKGGVVYTVESAREAAFRGMEYEISMEPYKGYMRDPGYRSMGEGKKPKVSKRGRSVTWFSDSGYCVSYYNQWDTAFYYNSNGILEGIDIDTKKFEFPRLSKKYDVKGKLTGVSYDVSLRESFIYDTNKTLIAHWIKHQCYDEKGQPIGKRW